jgi:hypothetical protein
MTNSRIASSLWTRRSLLAVIVSGLALSGCKSGSSINRVAAQKVSDSFMAYLVADRVNDAVGEMEPEMFQSATREQVEAQIRKLSITAAVHSIASSSTTKLDLRYI